jgi:hypothetical protein
MTTDPFIPLVADRAPLNSVKWAARDYVSIFDDLLRRLKAIYAEVYNDYATTVQGIMLIEMMAYSIAQLQWYLDRIASDCFLETARTSAAANRIVRQLGYKMRPAAASSTTVDLTFPDGTTGPFTMAARWRYQGPGGLMFESFAPVIEAAAVAPGYTVPVAVRQGETRILTFTADGTSNQTYALTGVTAGRYVADMSAEVWVDGLEWTEREFLTYAADEQFEVDYSDDPPKLRFGDGVAGLAPPLGAEVKVRFVIIDGVKGNDPKAHSITTSLDTLIVGGATVTFTVDNADAPVGGSDPETTDHARRIAPMSFAARGAAVTGPDYDALSNSFSDPLYGAVAQAYAFNPRGTYADLAFNNLVENVENYLVVYVALVTALETTIASAGTAMGPLLAAIATANADLETLRTDMVTWVGSAKTNVQGARAQCTTTETNLNTIGATATLQKADIDLLNAWVAGSAIAPADKAHLTSVLDAVSIQAQTVITNEIAALGQVQGAGTALDNVVSLLLNPALDALTNAAPGVGATSIPKIEADITTALTDLGVMQVALTAASTGIVGTAATLQADIIVETNAMRNQIAVLFSDDCMSNYVQVPILSLNADGEYVAPSVGLIMGLQAYLDGIKEVTQQVEVVDGTPALVQATIDLELHIGEAYIYAEEEAKVRAAIIALLKGRSFNQPLYESDLNRVIEAASVGIEYYNVRITGPAPYPDSDGNMVPPENKIIKLAVGGLTITQLYE